MGLIKKLWNHSLECGVAAATGPSDAGRLVPCLCFTVPESGVVNTAASELCGRSGAGSCGGGVGLAGRPWGARSAPLGGRNTDGARGVPHKGREGVTDEVGGWMNERTGEQEWVAGQTGG